MFNNEEATQAANLERQKQLAAETVQRNQDQLVASLTAVAERIEKAIESKSNQVLVDNFPESPIDSSDISQIIEEIQNLQDKLSAKNTEDKTSHKLLEDLISAVKNIPTEQQEQKEFPKSFEVSNSRDYTKQLKDVIDAVKAIQVEVKPEITVTPAEVRVENDYSTLEDKLDMLLEAVRAVSIVVPEKDDSEVISAVKQVSKTVSELRFPVANYVLPFKGKNGATQAQLDDNGYIAKAPVTERYDVQGTIIYVGEAPVGSSESDAVWKLNKFDLSDLTQASGKLKLNGVWTNRASEVYA